MSDFPKEEQLDTKPTKNDPPIKPKNSKSVAVYLVVLFFAAFMLLLMAYFMQQRSNDEIIDNLQDSVNQFQTVDELREENEKLREQLTALEAELEEVRSQKETIQTELDGLNNRYESLTGSYNTAIAEYSAIESLYAAEIMLAQEDYTGAAVEILSLKDLGSVLEGIDAKNHHYNENTMLFLPRYDKLITALTDMGRLIQQEDGTLTLVSSDS